MAEWTLVDQKTFDKYLKEYKKMSTEYQKLYKSVEQDPNGKQPHEPGAKLDAGKSPIWRGLIDYFPRACRAVAGVSQYGANKYAWKGWESVPDGFARYSDALARHLSDESLDGRIDPDSGQLHAAQVAWNAMARLELLLKEIDADHV